MTTLVPTAFPRGFKYSNTAASLHFATPSVADMLWSMLLLLLLLLLVVVIFMTAIALVAGNGVVTDFGGALYFVQCIGFGRLQRSALRRSRGSR